MRLPALHPSPGPGRSHARRASSLVVFILMIPAAMTLLMLTLTRVELGMAEADRAENRLQARLLAESALALYQADPGATLPIEGEIAGVGSYEVVEGEGPEGARRLVARGRARGPSRHSDGTYFLFIAEIELELADPSDPRSARPVGSRSRIEQIEP